MAERTPAAWLELLERRLHNRWNEWALYDAYYDGDHRLSSWLRKVQRAFSGTVLGTLLNGLTDNYMPLVVDSAAERLKVQGFRYGKQEEADDEAWAIWQANGLDAQSNMVHTEAIKLGEAYWLVQPNGDTPKITCEHPSQVIVACAPGDRRTRLAALKEWVEDGYIYANVYLPNQVVKYRTKETIQAGGVTGGRPNFVQIDAVRNSLGVVPVIPMPNNPSMLKGGKSDLAGGAISLQDQISKAVADLLIGAEYHGLPQRVLLGVEAPRDTETGRVVSDMEAARSRLWYFSSPDAKAHEFSQADLKGLRESIDGFIGDLSAQNRVPIYYFRPQAISNISAEALIGLDAGLVSRTNDKKDPFGEGHEETMALAFKSIDPSDPRAKVTDAETVWADTESRSHAQVVDAAVKKQTLGVPFEQIMEDIGYTPQQIDRMVAQREADALLAQAIAPAQPSNGQPPDSDGVRERAVASAGLGPRDGIQT